MGEFAMGNSFFVDYMENLEAVLSDAYITRSTVFSILVGILACIFIVVASVMMKKGMVYGIITGIVQIVGAFCTQKMVHIFLQMNHVQFETITGTSQAELDQKMEEFYADYFSNFFADMIPLMLCSVIMVISWVMALIFIIKSMKRMPKIFPVLAIILHIFRYLFVVPYDVITPIFAKVTDSSQGVVDIGYYFVTLLPFFVIMIGSFFCKKHAEKTAAKEAAKVAQKAEAEENA